MSRAKLSDDEKKARRRESCRRWRENNPEKVAAYNAAHREERAAYQAAYNAAYRAANPDYDAVWRAANPEKVAAYQAAYRAAHKEERAAYRAAYNASHKEKIAAKQAAYNAIYLATKRGRAVNLVGAYKKNDKNRGFDTSNNVTADWIEENIFSGQSCIYCGDSEWEHLGCDRINNDKPHTPDNVVCACFICNSERSDTFSVEEFKEYRKLNPRILGTVIEKSWEISELPSGMKVIKKKGTIKK